MLPSYELSSLITRLARRAPAEEDAATTQRQAAVAAILRAPEAGGDAEILLIQRAEREGDPWSGHMAFPGGRRDAGDATLLATAIRETREEVGLDLAEQGALLTRLPDVRAVARGKLVDLVIAPFVFELRAAPATTALTLSPEVAEALWVPIGPMARGEIAGTYPYTYEGRSLELPCHYVSDRAVWGLTHRMLALLFEDLHGA